MSLRTCAHRPRISDASYLCKLDVRGPKRRIPITREAVEANAGTLADCVAAAHRLHCFLIPYRRYFALQRDTARWTKRTLSVAEADHAQRERFRHARVQRTTGTRLAHVSVTILRGNGFLILNTRDVAQYVWEALLHAGARPFGMIAQQRWMGIAP